MQADLLRKEKQLEKIEEEIVKRELTLHKEQEARLAEATIKNMACNHTSSIILANLHIYFIVFDMIKRQQRGMHFCK